MQVTRMVPKLVAYQVNMSVPATVTGGGCAPAYPTGSSIGGSMGIGCGCGNGIQAGGMSPVSGVIIGGCNGHCGVSVGCPNCR